MRVGVLWVIAIIVILDPDPPGIGLDGLGLALHLASVQSLIVLVCHYAEALPFHHEVPGHGISQQLPILVPADFMGTQSRDGLATTEGHDATFGHILHLNVLRECRGCRHCIWWLKAQVTHFRAMPFHERPSLLTESNTGPWIAKPLLINAAVQSLDAPDVVLCDPSLPGVRRIGVHECTHVAGVHQPKCMSNFMSCYLHKVIEPNTLFPAESRLAQNPELVIIKVNLAEGGQECVCQLPIESVEAGVKRGKPAVSVIERVKPDCDIRILVCWELGEGER